MSALMYLALKGTDAASLAYLIEAGADATLSDDFGDTAAEFIAENKALSASDVTNQLAALQH